MVVDLQLQYGVINSFLASLGIRAIPFLSSQALVKPSLILIHCWAAGGTMIIFLAALQDVPRSLYEAAGVDGANGLQRFLNITIPMCTPAILFNLLTGMIGAFQYFTFAWILTQGGPNRASEFYALTLPTGFVYLKMGCGSALAWVLYVIVVVATILLFALQPVGSTRRAIVMKRRSGRDSMVTDATHGGLLCPERPDPGATPLLY